VVQIALINVTQFLEKVTLFTCSFVHYILLF
jgi:hypothetical protein